MNKEYNILTDRKNYDKTDGFFAVVFGVLGFLFIRFFLFYDWSTNFEFSIRIYTIAYIAAVYAYTKAKGKIIPKESYFWMAVMLTTAFFFKPEEFFVLLSAIAAAAYFTSVTGGLFRGGTSGYIIIDLIYTFIIKPFGNFFSAVPAFITLFKKDSKAEKQPVSPAVWGAMMGAVALRFILPLLTGADSNFLSGTTDFISHVFAVFDNRSMAEFMFHIVFSLPVTCYLFGLSYGSISKPVNRYEKENIVKSRENMRISPALTLKVFLYMVCAVYVMFIALQANYLLGAFTGRLYDGMTYAQYARTGFFELCKVAGINLSILTICNLCIKKEEESQIKSPRLLLCILSLLLLSTAMAKMIMYICAYGLTFKRVVSTVFLIWLVVVFRLCIAGLYRQFNLTKAAVLIGAVMYCAMFSFDISLHRHSFNEKYGFKEKIPQIEYAVEYNSLILPEKDDITVIEITDSKGNFYKEVSATGEIIDLLKTAADTEKTSVQDYPYAEFYYALHIHYLSENRGDSDITTVFIYKDGNYFYIEQPYYLICRSDFNWDSILIPYRSR